MDGVIPRVAVLTASISRKAGGLFTSVRRLAQELAGAGEYEVDVFSFRDDSTEGDLKSWLPLRPQIVSGRVALPSVRESNYTRAVLAWDPQLVHTQSVWLHPAFTALSWAKRTGRPYLVTTRGMLDPWALANSGWKKKVVGWLYANAHLRKAACIHALCQSELRSLRGYGLRNPICVIPNGIDLPPASDPGAPPWAVSGQKVLLFLSRLHPKKNLPALLRAWAANQKTEEGRRKTAGWVLAIAGWDQGGHEAELKRLATDLTIPWEDVRDHSALRTPHSEILFLGPQYGLQKDSCYFHADAFCLPSLSEGLPMAVLEAWAYKLPVVMTGECNLPEGFLASAAFKVNTEADGIANGLKVLMGMSDSERAAIGQRGHELVTGRFAWPNIAREMACVYNWVLRGGLPPNCVVMDENRN